ncbi:MAG: hypothetical protein JWQ27_373 [Ferruginibacter sp.]|nr:hypothetical protein [Ferruginibacter sp.]
MSKKDFFDVLDICAELVGWLFIACSIAFFAGLLAFFISTLFGEHLGFIIGCIIFGIGILGGIIYASRIFKTTGTIRFLSNSSWRNSNDNMND